MPQNEQETKSSILKRKRERVKWYIIDPRTNQLVGYWDLLTSLALVFTALVTPIEVAFLSAPSGAERLSNGLFWTNRVVDCVFIADSACLLRHERTNNSPRGLPFNARL
jgi:hypothetical protein